MQMPLKLCAVDVAAQPERTLPDMQSRDEAVRYLRAKRLRGAAATPHFLAVGLHKPHVPFKFPKEFLDSFLDTSSPVKLNAVTSISRLYLIRFCFL